MLGDLARRLRGRAGFDDAHVSVAPHAQARREGRRGRRARARRRLVEELREVKDAAELARDRAAAELADEAYEVAARARPGGPHRARGGARARALRWRTAARRAVVPADRRVRARTARCRTPSRATSRSRAGTLVVVDMGAQLDGYCSDCTRTFATGALDDEAARGLRARAARRSRRRSPRCAPGADVQRGRRAWRATIIEAAGHGEHFGHGLGHGVGLEVHEAPRLGKTAEGELAAGQRGDGRARRLPARRVRRADRGPRGRHRRRARGPDGLPQGARDGSD